MTLLPPCAVIGCTQRADPRWYGHAPTGALVMICDGHPLCGAVESSAAVCTCPPTRHVSPRKDPLAHELHSLRTLRRALKEWASCLEASGTREDLLVAQRLRQLLKEAAACLHESTDPENTALP